MVPELKTKEGVCANNKNARRLLLFVVFEKNVTLTVNIWKTVPLRQLEQKWHIS